MECESLPYTANVATKFHLIICAELRRRNWTPADLVRAVGDNAKPRTIYAALQEGSKTNAQTLAAIFDALDLSVVPVAPETQPEPPEIGLKRFNRRESKHIAAERRKFEADRKKIIGEIWQSAREAIIREFESPAAKAKRRIDEHFFAHSDVLTESVVAALQKLPPITANRIVAEYQKKNGPA